MLGGLMMKETGLVLDAEKNVGAVAPASLVDESRFGNDGVCTDVTWVQIPPFGLWVMSLNGATSLVDCGNDKSLDITNAVTLEQWLSTTTLLLQTILAKGTGATTNYIIDLGSVTPGLLRFFGYSAGASKGITASGGTAINDGVFHHIVGTFDGTNWLIYVDANLDRSVIDAATLTPTAEALHIGARGLAGWFLGLIAPVRIYNYVLSPGQILKHYEATRRFFGV